MGAFLNDLVRESAVTRCGKPHVLFRCSTAAGLLVLVMPVDGKAPGLLRCLECDRIDPGAVTTKEK